jgi:hypothetical protein
METVEQETAEGNPPSFITQEMIAALDQVIAEHKGKPGALIPALQRAQEICGYLPADVEPQRPMVGHMDVIVAAQPAVEGSFVACRRGRGWKYNHGGLVGVGHLIISMIG